MTQRFVFDQIRLDMPLDTPDGQIKVTQADGPDAGDPAFLAIESEAVRSEAYEEGRRAGHDQGLQEGMELACRTLESQVAAAIASIAADISSLARDQSAMFEAIAKDCERLVRIVFERLLPETFERSGCDEIVGVVRMALAVGCNDPAVEVRMAPELVERMRPRLEKLARDAVFRGKLELLADTSLPAGAVHARWLHGSAQRNPEQILAEVAAVTGWNLQLPTEIARAAPGKRPAMPIPTDEEEQP